MTSGLTWLNELMTWFGRWIPRIVLIEPTHRGVRFGPKGDTRQVGPGIVVYWPITHSLVLVPITVQSMQLSGQAITRTGDTHGLVPRVTICSVAVQFKVVNPVLAATAALKTHAVIDNRAQAAMAHHVHDDRKQWIENARGELMLAIRPFGLELERLDFTQHGVGVAIKQVESGFWQDDQHGQRAATA